MTRSRSVHDHFDNKYKIIREQPRQAHRNKALVMYQLLAFLHRSGKIHGFVLDKKSLLAASTQETPAVSGAWVTTTVFGLCSLTNTECSMRGLYIWLMNKQLVLLEFMTLCLGAHTTTFTHFPGSLISTPFPNHVCIPKKVGQTSISPRA